MPRSCLLLYSRPTDTEKLPDLLSIADRQGFIQAVSALSNAYRNLRRPYLRVPNGHIIQHLQLVAADQSIESLRANFVVCWEHLEVKGDSTHLLPLMREMLGLDRETKYSADNPPGDISALHATWDQYSTAKSSFGLQYAGFLSQSHFSTNQFSSQFSASISHGLSNTASSFTTRSGSFVPRDSFGESRRQASMHSREEGQAGSFSAPRS